MKKQGFELKRGERGSDRKHIETAKFKKQTLEKEIDFLEKNLAVKKDEWTAYSDKVKSDLEVPAKRHMKSVEVPTGEKSMFGLVTYNFNRWGFSVQPILRVFNTLKHIHTNTSTHLSATKIKMTLFLYVSR
ncbi:hypothetical protein AS237_12065 [Enterococcus faecium]|nr:hypothetical protein AS237_12065 [Enterococcus faecium]